MMWHRISAKTGNQRIVSLLIVVALCLLALVGCSKAGKTGKVTVSLAHFGDAAKWQAITKDFMKKNPDIEVKLLSLPGDGYVQKISSMYAGGTPPDVLWNNAQAAEFASRGVLLDLTPYIERDKKEMDLSDIYPQLLEGCKYKGKYYWFPANANADVIFYNKKLFDAAKLPYPDENLTYGQFLDLAKKLTKDTDGDGRIDQYGAQIFWQPDWILGHVLKSGGEIFSPDMSKCLIDLPENIAAIQWYSDLYRKHKIAPTDSALKTQSDIDMFSTGRLAMFNCAWYVSSFFKNIETFEWDVAPVPKQPGKPRITYGGMNLFLIAKKTSNPEAAWTLVKYLTSPEGQKYFLKGGYDMPIRKSVTEMMPELVDYPEHREVFVDALQCCRLVPEYPGRGEVTHVFQNGFDEIYYKNASVEKTCRNMATSVNAILKSKREEVGK